jgi:hypothetical protein
MANIKISALTSATTPLAGTEILPIVQSSTTKQVSVANLTAGRAISATELTLTTGNLIISTSGKGIDFSATPGTGTSELFNDYEEGTWTPNQGAGVTVVGTFSSSGTYTKIGRQVFLTGIMFGSTSIACTAASILTSNLPYSTTIDGPIGRALTANTAIFCDVYPSAAALYTANVALTATGYIRFSITTIV